MRRFFASPEQIASEKVKLTGQEARHISTVLRLKVGDEIEVLDGNGSCYRVRLLSVTKNSVTGEILSTQAVNPESPLKISLGQALIKGNKLDDVIRKAVELGVHSMCLLNTDRTVAKVKEHDMRDRRERWQKIAQEAAKQCGRNTVPDIHDSVLDFQSFVTKESGCDLNLMFWEDEGNRKLSDLAETHPEIRSVSLLMGPEGGFSQQEVDLARASGYQTLSLGPRILRADTATVAALSLVQQQWGDL